MQETRESSERTMTKPKGQLEYIHDEINKIRHLIEDR